MLPGTKARVVRIDPYGWWGRDPHPTRQEIGKVVEVLGEVADTCEEEEQVTLYECALLDFTRTRMVFCDYELEEF